MWIQHLFDTTTHSVHLLELLLKGQSTMSAMGIMVQS